MIRDFTMKKAIRQKCIDCAYDEYAGGMKNITACCDLSCPLWAFRPLGKLNKAKAYLFKQDSDAKMLRGEWTEEEMTPDEKKKYLKRKETSKLAVRKMHERKV